jgi:hypothetical protein
MAPVASARHGKSGFDAALPCKSHRGLLVDPIHSRAPFLRARGGTRLSRTASWPSMILVVVMFAESHPSYPIPWYSEGR